MASAWYQEGLHGLMNKEIDLDTDTIKVRAVSDSDYTFSQAHTTMSSVTGYLGTTDPTLTCDITTTKGTLDASDLTPAFASLSIDVAKTIDALVIYHFVTNDAGSTPLIYIDLTTPVTPNGTDVNITWNASGIASL